MKASALISELQRQIAINGDREVVMQCDDLETEIDIGAIGFLTEKNGEQKYMLNCAECHAQFTADEIAAGEGYT